MEPDTRLRMTQGARLPETVVVFDEPGALPSKPVDSGTGRQGFLMLFLLLTSVLAYLVFSGVVKF